MTTLILLLVGGFILLRFGVGIARWLRARDDYKKVKAGLPGMRKTKWSLFWGMIKVGALVVFAYALLVAVAGHEARRNVSDRPDSPAPATSSAATRSR